LNIDTQALGGSNQDPLQPFDDKWLLGVAPAMNYPLTVHEQDLRSNCLASFQLKRSDLLPTLTAKGKGLISFVIMDDNQNPLGGDRVIACFSNCGRYAFPDVPPGGPNCPDSDPTCFNWKSFCLTADPSTYQKSCSTDAN
jgi:hypothetical protein